MFNIRRRFSSSGGSGFFNGGFTITAIKPFLGPKLKIERANRHLAEFEAESANYRERYPHYMVFDQHFGEEARIAYSYKIHPPPPFLSTIVGDVVHNLRAALDQLICDLVRINGKEEIARAHHFPICEDPNAFEADAKNKIKGVSTEARQMILALKPHATRDGPIWSLNKLNILDKHQGIIIVAALAAISGVTLQGGGHVVRIPSAEISSEHGLYSEARSVSIPPITTAVDLVPNKDMQTTATIVFGEGQPFEREAVFPTLVQVSQFVGEIVEAFARRFG